MDVQRHPTAVGPSQSGLDPASPPVASGATHSGSQTEDQIPRRLLLRFLLPGWKRGSAVIVTAILVLVGGGASYAFFLGGGSGPSPSTQTNSINLSKGLVGWWKFAGNAKDSTPYANNGTVNGATLTTDREGTANGAYSFNGTNASITASGTSLGLTQPMSASVWVNTSSTYAVLFRNGQFSIQVEGGAAVAGYICIAGGWSRVAATHTSGVWENFVLTYDGSHMIIYKNGALAQSAALTGNLSFCDGTSPPDEVLYMGTYVGGAPWYLSGSLEDMRIYNRALSSAEVTALYKQYNPSLSTDSGENGLVGWWKLNGNAKDFTPYANNGTVDGATLTTDREGTPNSAYSFNGSSSYIEANTEPYTNSITASAWVYSTQFSQSGFVVSEDPVNSQWELFFEGPWLKWRGGSPITDTKCAAPANNVWHYIVGTQSGTSTQLFIDGQRCTTATTTAMPSSGATALEIGRYNSGYYFNGSISDVRVYDRVLSATEITAQYKAYNSQVEIGGSGASGSVSLGKGLVGYWPLNGNAKDSTPYSNNGTLVNSPTLTTDREGRANSAYSFSGSNYISISSGPSLNNDPVSFALWVNEPSSSYGTFLIGKSTYGALLRDNGSGNYQWDIAGYYDVFASIPSYNQWHFLVGTYNGSTEDLYVDGTLHATASLSVTPTGTTDLGIGACIFCGPGQYTTGSIDDVRIYNRALNSAEVQALYNEYE